MFVWSLFVLQVHQGDYLPWLYWLCFVLKRIHVVGNLDDLLPVLPAGHYPADRADSAELWLNPQYGEVITLPIAQIGVPGSKVKQPFSQDLLALGQTSVPLFSCKGNPSICTCIRFFGLMVRPCPGQPNSLQTIAAWWTLCGFFAIVWIFCPNGSIPVCFSVAGFNSMPVETTVLKSSLSNSTITSGRSLFLDTIPWYKLRNFHPRKYSLECILSSSSAFDQHQAWSVIKGQMLAILFQRPFPSNLAFTSVHAFCLKAGGSVREPWRPSVPSQSIKNYNPSAAVEDRKCISFIHSGALLILKCVGCVERSSIPLLQGRKRMLLHMLTLNMSVTCSDGELPFLTSFVKWVCWCGFLCCPPLRWTTLNVPVVRKYNFWLASNHVCLP